MRRIDEEVEPEALEALEKLLVSSFDTTEFIALLRSKKALISFVNALAPGDPPQTFIHSAIHLLQRNQSLGDDFFDAVVEKRPKLKDELETLRMRIVRPEGPGNELASVITAHVRGNRIVALALGFLLLVDLLVALQPIVFPPRAQVSIASVGFSGPRAQGGTVELSDNVMKMSSEDLWGPTLRRYVPFDALHAREQSTTQTMKLLGAAKTMADAWVGSPPEREQLSFREIEAVPIMVDDAILSSLFGRIRRMPNSVFRPPVGLRGLRATSIIVPMSARTPEGKDDDGANYLLMSSKHVKIPKLGPASEVQELSVQLLTESISRGHLENLLWYHERFIESTTEELLIQNELQKALRETLTPRAHLVADVVITNPTDRVLSVRPHFVMSVQLSSFNQSFSMASLQPEREEPNDFFSAVQALVREDNLAEIRGQEYVAEPFLSAQSDSPYIIVPPKSARNVRVHSSMPISFRGAISEESLEGARQAQASAEGRKQADLIWGHYADGSLGCEVIAAVDDGNRLQSRTAYFGKGIPASMRAVLENLVQVAQN